jgi:hypothetical protein
MFWSAFCPSSIESEEPEGARVDGVESGLRGGLLLLKLAANLFNVLAFFESSPPTEL